jgi:DNA-binding transcriptional ArsR family regulator
MSAKPEIRGAAPVFAALGDETRLLLVSRLCTAGPMSITKLATGTAVTRQAITKHLHVLASAGVVRASRRGREQIWQLEPKPLFDARRSLELISRQWDSALDRLRSTVEQDPLS